MSEWTYITLAYGITWAALIGYAIYLARQSARVKALREEARRLTAAGGDR
jgi:CcmD family protein